MRLSLRQRSSRGLTRETNLGCIRHPHLCRNPPVPVGCRVLHSRCCHILVGARMTDHTTPNVVDGITQFEGTPTDFVDFVVGLWPDMGTFTVDRGGTDSDPATVYRFATGGWSVCEQILDAIRHTMFHALFWESSHRGGLVVYVVPDRQMGWCLPAIGNTTQPDRVQ